MSRFLSYAQLDTIAGRVVRAYRKLPEVQAARVVHSVDPQLLLTKLLGLSVAFRHISWDGETLGMTSYEELEIEIFDKEEEFFSGPAFWVSDRSTKFHDHARGLPPCPQDAVSEGL